MSKIKSLRLSILIEDFCNTYRLYKNYTNIEDDNYDDCSKSIVPNN